MSWDQKVGTGIMGFDEILEGGLPTGHLYLIEGDPGAGKTTLALQFLSESRTRGESTLYITFSESIRELKEIARSHGWSLDGIHIFECMPSPESFLPEDQYTVFHPADIELGATFKRIVDEIEAINPSCLVVDSLAEVRILARDQSRYRRHLLGLKQFLGNRRCSALLLDNRQVANSSDRYDSSVLSVVHGVVRLEQLGRNYGIPRRRLEIVKLRGSDFHGGYHDYDIKTGGLHVYPRLAAVNHKPAERLEGSLSGIQELDALLNGGLDRGTSTLIIGPAGSGKSSIAIQYAASAARRGEFGLIFTFDEALKTVFQRSRGLGFELQDYIDAGSLAIEQLDPGEINPGGFIQRIRWAVETRNLRVLVLDSVNGFMNALPDGQEIMPQLHELLSYLNERNVVTILVMAQYGILGQVMGSPVDISYLADTVLLLRFFEAQGKVRRAMSVVKKRSGGHEDSIREFHIGPGGIVVGSPLTQFQGVLTGAPVYVGESEKLIDLKDGNDRG